MRCILASYTVLDDARLEVCPNIAARKWKRRSAAVLWLTKRLKKKETGASRFKYGGNYLWSEQLDMYDYTNITNLIKECVQKGVLKEIPLMSVEQV